MHLLEDWRIRDVEAKAERAVNRLHELDSLRSNVARLERTNEGLSSACDGLRATCEALLSRIERLEQDKP